MANAEIMELKRKVAFLEATLADVCEDNEVWEKIFLENSWGMVVADAMSGKLLKVNPYYAKMHGYKPHELIGKSMYDALCAPGHRDDWWKNGLRIQNDVHEYNSVHVRKDGSCFPVRIKNYEITVKEQCLRIVSTWDISENELEEKELSQYRDSLEYHRLYSLFNSFPGLIYVREENHKIRFANNSFQAKFGPCIDQPCYEVIAGLPIPCSDCMSSMVLRSLTAVWKEMLFDNRIYEVYSQPFIDADGSKLVFKVLIDITDRRRADRELARLDRLNMIGEMAAGIAHEVRNPLTTVRGFLQLLQSKVETVDYHDYYQLMTDELDRANLILSDFLSLARDRSVDFKLINITKIITALTPLLTADAINQDKKIIFELEEVPDIHGNGNELRQLILNLARNGFEAMQAGTALTIRTYTFEDEIVLKVCDQGGGIDPDILEKLGTPFLTTKERGTGLGITICQSIAVRHKASISFDSEHTGTTVTVKFPLDENL